MTDCIVFTVNRYGSTWQRRGRPDRLVATIAALLRGYNAVEIRKSGMDLRQTWV
jgi:hypothetical protein